MYKIRPVLSLFCNKCESRSRGILFCFCVSIFLLYLTEFQMLLNFINIDFHFVTKYYFKKFLPVSTYSVVDVTFDMEIFIGV